MAALPATAALAAPDIDDIEDVGDMLEVMVDDLSTQGDGCGGVLRVGEPSVTEDTSGVVFASSPVLLIVGGTTEASGTTFLTVDPDLGTVDNNLTGVSTQFKKCMKGRAGCGGSSFERTKVSCADDDDCGPCGDNAWGCSIGGAKIWYCAPESMDNCECANVVFHEMAHSCGYLDDPDCDPPNPNEAGCPVQHDPDDYSGACRVGYLMNEECCSWVTEP